MDNKNLIILIVILILSLIISALIFNFISQINDYNLIKINYDKLKEYSFVLLFLEILKKNIIYFVLIIILSLFGLSSMIYLGFSLITIIYGVSMIYFVQIVSGDKLYLILNILDYLVYYPALFYFTYNSLLLSKKIKKVKTNSKKIDIILKKHISISALYISLVIIYSSIQSFWIYLILLFKS